MIQNGVKKCLFKIKFKFKVLKVHLSHIRYSVTCSLWLTFWIVQTQYSCMIAETCLGKTGLDPMTALLEKQGIENSYVAP